MTQMFDIVPPSRSADARKSLRVELGQGRKNEEERDIPIHADLSESEEEIAKPAESRALTEDAFLQKLARERSEKPWFTPAPKFGRRIIVATLILAVLITATWIASSYVARATVTITTERAFQPFSIDVKLDKSLSAPDFSGKRLPLQVLQKTIDLAKSYDATGEGAVSAKAHGTITIYNKYSSAAQILIANTRFAAPDGKIFRLSSRVTIPGNGSVKAEVIADQPGPAYNIGPTIFKIVAFQGSPRYDTIYGESKAAMVGGAAGKTKIVTAGDIQRATQDISQFAFEALRKDLSNSVPPNFILLEKGGLRWSVSSLTPDVKTGDAADTFNIKIRAEADALIFDETQVAEMAREELADKVNLQMFPRPNFSFAYTPVGNADFVKGTMSLKVDGAIDVSKSLDVKNLKANLAGKNDSEVRRILLAIPGITEAKVAMWPVWVRRMPDSADRINIVLK